MSRPFIVIGDRTDHGGVVIGSSQTTDTHGKRIARVGDQVTCPKKGHGGTTVIVSGDPTMIIDGQPAARHGDKCACGATLIASQAVSTVGGGGGGSRAMRHDEGKPIGRTSKTNESASHPEDPYDQFFVLTNELNGAALAGLRYRLTWLDKTVEGTTDTEGKTERVSAPKREEVKIEVLGSEN